MNSSEVAIATMTLARDAAEEAVLREALDALAHVGLPVFATDGGSSAGFIKALNRCKGFVLCKPARAGLWAQVEASLDAARSSGARFILYTEPDKLEFFRDALLAFIAEAPARKDSGVILASRSPASLSTFPAFQQYTEGVINRCCAQVLGHAFDYTYGPFLMNATLVEHLDARDEALGWGWRPYAFGIAHRLGLRIDELPTGCACPSSQRSESVHLYRMEQMAQSVRGLVLAAQAPLDSGE